MSIYKLTTKPEKKDQSNLRREYLKGAGMLFTSYSYGFHASVRPEILAAVLLVGSGLRFKKELDDFTGTDHKRGIERALKGGLITQMHNNKGMRLTPEGKICISHLFTCLERGVPSRSVLLQKYILTTEAFRIHQWPRYYEHYDNERKKLMKVKELRDW